jgi:antitoxin HicB
MKFPVNLTKEPEGGYTVTFPDIPEAITCGTSIEDALVHAKDALESAMDFYFDDQRPVPAPSRAQKGQHSVEISLGLSAKVLLLNEMVLQKVRPADLARRMKVTPQEVNRLTNLRYGSKIDGIAAAAKALNKTLEIRLV